MKHLKETEEDIVQLYQGKRLNEERIKNNGWTQKVHPLFISTY